MDNINIASMIMKYEKPFKFIKYLEWYLKIFKYYF